VTERNSFHYRVMGIDHAKLSARVGQVKHHSPFCYRQDVGHLRSGFTGRYPDEAVALAFSQAATFDPALFHKGCRSDLIYHFHYSIGGLVYESCE
jgi:hypothetical protein